LTVNASDDHGITAWGYRLSGVLDSVTQNPVTGTPTILNKSTWIDIPETTAPGELTITAFVLDNAGTPHEGDADPLVITVEKRYFDYTGTVYRADGTTFAAGASVLASYNSGDFGQVEMGGMVGSDGRFRIESFFDRKLSYPSYTLKVVYNDGNTVEAYKSEHSGTPTADVDETIILAPPEPPTAFLEVNSAIPLFMVDGAWKPALLHVTSDWDVADYTWTLTGMFGDGGQEFPDNQSPAYEIDINCPSEWFPDSIPVTPGTVTLTATVTDEFGQTVTTDPVTIQVVPARASVSGRLLESDGTPAAGGEVFLKLNINNQWGSIYHPDTFYTVAGTDGSFNFSNILKLDEFRWEDVDFDEQDHPVGLISNTATLNELTVSGSLLNADFHGSAVHVETALPSGDLAVGDMTLADSTDPVLVVAAPLDGSAAVIGEAVSIDAYVKADSDPVSVVARTGWSGTDTVLADQGEVADFRWGGRSGYHRFTGSVPIPAGEGGEWFAPLALKVIATDGTGKTTKDTRTLQAFDLGESGVLPVPKINTVFPGTLQSAPVTMPGMILPLQILDESGMPPAFFRFAAAKYDPADIDDGGFGNGKSGGNPVINKGIMSDGSNGYGELADPDHYTAAQCLRFTLQAGSDEEDSLYLTLNIPVLAGYEAHDAAELAGDLSGWADKDVFLTSGTLLIDGDVAFRNLVVATGATVEMSGSASLTVTGRLVLMPGATLSNINPGGTPAVAVSGTDLFLYGDYTGKGQPGPPFTFTATGGIHEQNN